MTKVNSDQKKKEPEIYPDAWARFERAVDVVAKSPPQHRTKPAKPTQTKRAKKTPGAKGNRASLAIA
jgi:hypothetical protein